MQVTSETTVAAPIETGCGLAHHHHRDEPVGRWDDRDDGQGRHARRRTAWVPSGPSDRLGPGPGPSSRKSSRSRHHTCSETRRCRGLPPSRAMPARSGSPLRVQAQHQLHRFDDRQLPSGQGTLGVILSVCCFAFSRGRPRRKTELRP